MNEIEKEIEAIPLQKIIDPSIDNCRTIYKLVELQFQAYKRAFLTTTFNAEEKEDMLYRFPEVIFRNFHNYNSSIVLNEDMRLFIDYVVTSFVIKLKNI